jgi:chromosome segregation and condensation protein ScpB
MQNDKNNTMKNTTLTQNEIEVLTNVAMSQMESGYSEYQFVESESEKGTLGSLVKKGLIYDAYENEEGNDYMYCLTDEGLDMCDDLNISTEHITNY